MPSRSAIALALALPLLLPLCGGCRPGEAPRATPEVVVYVSLDEPYARPVLESFRRETGIGVRPVYDTEANKSRGLALRIQSERARPRADVFWSSEVMQMLSLRKAGALQPYRSPAAEGIPAEFRDPDGFWTGFAARFRVLACSSKRVKSPPRSLLELTDPRWKAETAMADPLFGTTTTEAVALFAKLGTERARRYYEQRKANGARVVAGNSVAADMAARGDVMVAQTDTDDAFVRSDRSPDLTVVFPDQDGMGALLIPNTAAMIAGAPHPDSARRFLDYLLRPETELLLAGLPSRQLPLHAGLQDRLPERVRPLARIRRMKVDYASLADLYPPVDRELAEIFQR